MYIPLAVQAKRGYPTMSVNNYVEILRDIQEDNFPKAIFHRRDRKADLVIMTRKDFYKLWRILTESSLKELVEKDLITIR